MTLAVVRSARQPARAPTRLTRGDDLGAWQRAFDERYTFLCLSLAPNATMRAADFGARGVVLGTTRRRDPTSAALTLQTVAHLGSKQNARRGVLQLVRTNSGSATLRPVEEGQIDVGGLHSDSDGDEEDEEDDDERVAEGMPPAMTGVQLARTNSRSVGIVSIAFGFFPILYSHSCILPVRPPPP